MPNLYGIANSVFAGVSAFTPGVVDLPCNPGVNTAVFTFNLSCPIIGTQWAIMWWSMGLNLGSPAPTNIVIGATINGGSVFQQLSVAPGELAANTSFQFSGTFITPTSYNFYNRPPAPQLVIQLNPTTTGMVVKGASSMVVAQLFIGND